MHHPCFLDFFDATRAGDGFRLHGGLFYLWLSDGSAAALHGDVCVSPPAGIGHSSIAARASNDGRHEKQAGTNHSEFGVTVKLTGLRPCKQPENVLEKNQILGASGCLRLLRF